MILGFDEVGRGCWAGPMVLGACILPDDCQIEGLTDSKKLTAKKRLGLESEIRDRAVAFGLGWVEAQEIDKLGLPESLRLGARRALEDLRQRYCVANLGADWTKNPPFSQIIIDGTVNFLGDARVTTMTKADLLVPSVSAGAILAKVARDRFMIELGEQEKYAGYGFAKHVGYGTKAHHQAILELGVSDQHRLSFRPMSELVGFKKEEFAPEPTSKDIGYWGEEKIVQWLLERDFEILAQNWRHKNFEVDIVARKDEIIYLIEVKTRKNADFGGGEVAINAFKKRKLELASQTILAKYSEATVRPVAIFVTGEPNNFKISDLTEVF